MKRFLLTLVAAAAMLVFTSPAAAATGTLFGGATNENGAVKLVSDLSDTTTANDFSGIDWKDLAIKFEDLKTLSTQYNVTDDGCGGGSPRFQLNIDGKNVFVYLGPTPSFTGCALNTWLNSGNLVGSTDARFDLSQLGGNQAATYAEALAFLTGKTITGIQLVADAGWFFADKEQTVLVRNVVINGQAFFVAGEGSNIAQMCKAQRAAIGDAAFAMLYGTNANRANALGKCISTMNKAKSHGNAAAAQQVVMNASRSCKAERRADPAAFKNRYGTNGNKSNAFGKCVSSKAQASLTALAAGKKPEKGRGRR